MNGHDILFFLSGMSYASAAVIFALIFIILKTSNNVQHYHVFSRVKDFKMIFAVLSIIMATVAYQLFSDTFSDFLITWRLGLITILQIPAYRLLKHAAWVKQNVGI